MGRYNSNSITSFSDHHRALIGTVLITIDLLAVATAALTAYFIRFDTINLQSNDRIALALVLLIAFIILPRQNDYTSQLNKPLLHAVSHAIQASAILLLCGALLAYLSRTSEDYSRIWVTLWAFLVFIYIFLFQAMLRYIIHRISAQEQHVQTLIIVGDNPLSALLIKKIRLRDDMKIIGYLDTEDEHHHVPEDIPYIGNYQNLPSLIDSGNVIANQTVNQVWITLPLISQSAIIERISRSLEQSPISSHFLPDMAAFNLLTKSIDIFEGLPVIHDIGSPFIGPYKWLKRQEDILIASVGLILTMPIMLVVGVIIKLSGTGSVFFRQKRHGTDGSVINMYKFRTMYESPDDSPDVIKQATQNDSRITPIGKWLRKTSLDELPQLINVLQGNMSIVGPRPHALSHNTMYMQVVEGYDFRHKIKPGITGWAQVNGFRGETDTLDKMESRVQFDLEYIRNWSFGLDMKIIALTFVQIIVNPNGY